MMRSIEQVIILGAGASKSEGAPLQNELFKEFFKDQSIFEDIKKNDPETWKHIWNFVEEQERLIKDFFNDFWGIDVINYKNKVNFPTFEECLGMLDLANLQGQSFKGYDQEKINKTRNALIFIIAHHLDNRKLREINHRKLIDRLKSKNILKKTCPNFEDVEKILNDKISQTNDKDLIRLRNKLNKIFKFKIFSKQDSIDVNELFQKSTILDLSKLPDDFLFLVSDTILRKMYRNLKLRNPIEYNAKGKERFRIFIAIDEAKILVPSDKGDTKAIINIFGTEARKFGVGFIVSSQLTSHFGDDVLGNMATKIALKPLKHNIAKDNAKELSIDSQDLMNIKNPGEGFIRFSNEETKKIFLKSYEEKVKD